MKKMRRMIPALCMLLVSAIMLTTASYAWFTMNDQVTATGMQVQAKADGSLVISNNPLTHTATDTEVNFTNDGLTKLKPMTWATTGEGDTQVTGWHIPVNLNNVNSVSGKTDDEGLRGLDWTKDRASEYYFDKTMYVGSAGDTLTGKRLALDLSAIAQPAIGTATRAYSVAIYIYDNWDAATPANDAKPHAIIHVDNVDGRNEVTLTKVQNADDSVSIVKDTEIGNNTEVGFTIPTIVGVGDQNERVTGLKVVLRVFVDGGLVSDDEDKIEVPNGYEYRAAESFDANAQYFVQTFVDKYTEATVTGETFENMVEAGLYIDGDTSGTYVALGEDATYDETGATKYYTLTKEGTGVYILANVDNLTNVVKDENGKITSASFPAGETWYTRVTKYVLDTYHYINSQDVPTSGSTLEFGIKANDKPATQG